MNKRRKPTFYIGKKKKRLNLKKVAIVAIIGVVCIGGSVKAWSFVSEQRQIKLEQKKLEEKKRIEEEKRRKEEEEKKKYMIGVSHEAKKDSYDAKIISDKLSKYDYSNGGKKVVFLTFDDGTSTTVTPKVLKTLKDEGVKATFFLMGKNIEAGGDRAKELVKQEFKEGHAIANHSYSHDYKLLYPQRTVNLDSFKSDFEKTDGILKELLGKYFSTRVLRCPGGHMSWKGMDKLDVYLKESGKASIDWNALSADAQGKKKNAQELAEYAIKTSQGKEMVVLLMHDTYGKEETAKSLPLIIKYFKDNGYAFKTLA
ncbi:polysaccharide deacetylase [Romboutsia maritimum]|uniref:Polysaccharide deacetylase n=1 Tax=Romboutsia maritimum TaxID=2020948 RepID=A0A371IRE0_9FIRM|nr:polysaccharide deacetylase family protein [Romboutsia maritimum]RDY23034.1 polysaccharide deacetylase [Romboutsia maritimum]